MDNITIDDLKNFLSTELQSKPIISEIDKIKRGKASTAGSRSDEEIFTREFLCKALRKFFYEYLPKRLKPSDEDIKNGLGTEGFINCDGFGFTPARKEKHVLTKDQIIKSNPPDSWYKENDSKLTNYQACPDFAIREPLPFNLLGEVKYFKYGKPVSAVKELYNAVRQAIFYLGVYHGQYDAAMIAIADASKGHAFVSGLDLIKSDLLTRFGPETNIYLLPLKLT
jgi:hypothetical protein